MSFKDVDFYRILSTWMVFGDTFEKDEDFGRSAPFFYYPKIMKKILALIILSVFCLNAINAEITWKLENGTLTISGTGNMDSYGDDEEYNYYMGDPRYPYPNLAPWFFSREKIKNIIINNGVTSIGEKAFSGCSGLTSVTIPNSVTRIGGSTFKDCSNLISITIPSSVTSIGGSAFSGCSNLVSITIPSSVTSIGDYTFYWCSNLTSVSIGNSITSIGNYAFSGCSDLTSFTIPNSVTSIGRQAFENCSSLTSVTIPKTVTSIGNYAFYGCSGLTSIIVDKENHYYDSRDNCNAIIETKSNALIRGCKNTVIPNSVTIIGSHAFYGCSGLTSVTIGNSVTSIGNYAFSGCSGLASITIPNSVTSIGSDAFFGCSGLTSITIGMKKIGSTFKGRSSINSVTFLDGVANIDKQAFYGCSGIKEIYSWNVVPPVCGDEVFGEVNTLHAKVFVPEGAGDDYNFSKGWMNFMNIHEMEYTPVLAAADPITISDSKPSVTKGYYKEKTITYVREGAAISQDNYASFCLPFAVDPSDAQFKAVYVPVGLSLYNTESNTLRIGFYQTDDIISAGTPFLAQLAVDNKVEISNALPVNYAPNAPVAKTSAVRTFNYSNSAGIMNENNDYAINISGSYQKISPSNCYTFNTDGSIGASINVVPFRAYFAIAKNNSNARIITSFDIEAETTDIKNLQITNYESPVYDMNGRRVDEKSLKSGVYIKNGKKYVK